MRTALMLLAAAIAAAVDEARVRGSWLAIDEAICTRELVEGQRFEVAVDYQLAPGAPATLAISGHGPWIDLPDGTYESKRHHVDYPGLATSAEVQPGRGRKVFTFTAPKPHGRDSLLWIARFSEGGKAWPTEVRQGCGPLRAADPPLRIAGAAPGNLFTYAEPLRFALAFGAKAAPGAAVDAAWTVLGRDGAIAAAGHAALTVPAAGATVPLDIACERRGGFGLRVAIDGVGTAETAFTRIPDVMAITRGEPTRLGLHHLLGTASDAVLDERMTAARRLGLTFCRQFVPWKAIEPGRGEWRLDGLDRALAKAREHGIGAMISLVEPPAWAMTRRLDAGFEPFAFDEAGWSEAIATMTRRFKGRLAAWEWLNEIVPGPESDPIPTYLSMVRLGRAAAKAEDPAVLSVLAGGLWPRSFRLGLLAAGIGREIDVLPIHYGAGDGIAEAAADLAAVAAPAVQVWDDESARGVSTWRMPLGEALARDEQRAWAMGQIPGELAAGAQRVLWFGGGGDPAGNWDFRWSDGAPRPVAATLAVLAAKLHHAVPQGGFAIAGSGRFHLFAVDGRALLVAPAAAAATTVRVGSAAVTVSDDQGEERRVAARDGDAALPAAPLPFFVEGGDLDALRGYTAPELLTPQLGLLAGREERLRLRLTNRGTAPLACELAASLPAGWPAIAPLAATLAPGEARLVEIAVAAPAGTAAGEHVLAVAVRYADPRLPRVELPWRLAVVDPKDLGNRLSDGSLEAGGAAWGGDRTSDVVASPGFAQGLGAKSLHMGPSQSWQHSGQALAVSPGQTYLYSAWVRVAGAKEAGSNLEQIAADGSRKTLYMPSVFSAANGPDWQFLTKTFAAPADAARAAFVPVAKGGGDAWFDNLRVTVYEGTSFAAEATRAVKPPAIDGDLGDWAGGCPIPLLGPGQTTILDPAWKPSAANLRGVVKLAWDERNLYLAAWIDDDVLAAPETGERCPESDSLVFALHPGNRAPGSDARAYCYYVSPAAPGGGSGSSTLYRPAAHAGGLSSGQLAKDSSVYELAIRRDGAQTRYEARLPWSELGTTGRLGAKLGLSLQLNDNDGHGRAASIAWGDGLAPAWNPAAFGVLTLVE